jgi:hypothetical protein
VAWQAVQPSRELGASGEANEPTPLHLWQRPEFSHFLQLTVFISEVWTTGAGKQCQS